MWLMLIQPLSERERLALHIEVDELAKQLGILYKDAAHRLFLAKIEKMKTEERMVKLYANLRARIEDSLHGCQECLVRAADGDDTVQEERSDSIAASGL